MEQEAKQADLDDVSISEETGTSLDLETEGEIPETDATNDTSSAATPVKPVEPSKHGKTESPGRLKTKGSVLLHTRSAHDLFYGRRGDRESGVNQIVGLTLFATNANNLSMLCKRDDPYAEAVLIKIENLLTKFQQEISDKTKRVNKLLDETGGVVINFHESEDPIIIPLEFGTPYGYIAARCLSQYDKLVTLAYSAKHTGLLLSSDWHQYAIKTRTKLRHIFYVSTLYRFGGATRDDIAANNAVARSVKEKYGDLSEEILTKEKRAQYVSHDKS